MKKTKKKTLRRKKRAVPKKTPYEIAAELYDKRFAAVLQRVDALDIIVQQMLDKQRPLLEELYRARQDTTSVMRDIAQLKAAVLARRTGGITTTWEPG